MSDRVERTDGTRPRNVAQAMAEQLFELIENRCVDETFLINDKDHAVTMAELSLEKSPEELPVAGVKPSKGTRS